MIKAIREIMETYRWARASMRRCKENAKVWAEVAKRTSTGAGRY